MRRTTRKLLESGVPMLGICLGINHRMALGGRNEAKVRASQWQIIPSGFAQRASVDHIAEPQLRH